jgi:hypothetical protein
MPFGLPSRQLIRAEQPDRCTSTGDRHGVAIRADRRLGAHLFDAEHAGDGLAVVGRPPSPPADHAVPARFLISTMAVLCDGRAARSAGAARVTARLDRERASELLLGFRRVGGHVGDCGYPTTLTTHVPSVAALCSGLGGPRAGRRQYRESSSAQTIRLTRLGGQVLGAYLLARRPVSQVCGRRLKGGPAGSLLRDRAAPVRKRRKSVRG